MAETAAGGAEARGHGLLCPICRIDLVMSDRQGIEIDYCPKCRGVWLDRGELDKIIERSTASDPRATAPGAATQGRVSPFGGHGDGGHGSKHGDERRGRESFLSRLFD